MRYIIKVDKVKCIGCGACVSACGNFEMEENVARSTKSEVAKMGCNEQARDICPAGAIIIEERK